MENEKTTKQWICGLKSHNQWKAKEMNEKKKYNKNNAKSKFELFAIAFGKH